MNESFCAVRFARRLAAVAACFAAAAWLSGGGAARAQTVTDTSGIFSVTVGGADENEFEVNGAVSSPVSVYDLSAAEPGSITTDGSAAGGSAESGAFTLDSNDDYTVFYPTGDISYVVDVSALPSDESTDLSIGVKKGGIDFVNDAGTYEASINGTEITVTADASPTPELGSGVSFGILLACLAVWGGVRKRRLPGPTSTSG